MPIDLIALSQPPNRLAIDYPDQVTKSLSQTQVRYS